MERFIRKDYSLTLSLKSKKFLVKYKEATVCEVIEFLILLEKEDFNLLEWLENFIYSNSTNKPPKTLIRTNHTKIYKTLLKTHFKGVFGGDGDNKEGKKLEAIELSSYICHIAGKINAEPLYILNNYTFCMLEIYMKGLIYNANLETKDGKARNLDMINKEKIKSIDKTSINDIVSKLSNYHKKNAGGKDGDKTGGGNPKLQQLNRSGR